MQTWVPFSSVVRRLSSDDQEAASGSILFAVRVRRQASGFQLVDDEIPVRVDTDIRRYVQRPLDDVARREVGARDERAGGGQRERPAGADGGHVVLGLDDVAVAGDDE